MAKKNDVRVEKSNKKETTIKKAKKEEKKAKEHKAKTDPINLELFANAESTSPSNVSSPATRITSSETNKKDNSIDFDILSEKRLQRDFFMTDGVDLAKKLIGKIICRKVDGQWIQCRIVETEAYCGPHDKAAHCYDNKKTDRTKYFWQPGGHLYIYSIYGANWCLNIVAGEATVPEAILIRAVEPISGLNKIIQLRGMTVDTKKISQVANLVNGPGKVGQSLGLEKSHNALDLVTSKDMFLIDEPSAKHTIDRSIRINIDYAAEYVFKPWRFFVKGNAFVSKVKIKHDYKDE